MVRLKLQVCALLVASLLAGCGAPMMASMQATQNVQASSLAASKNQQATSLINKFKAIKGYSRTAMALRARIVDELSDTDSDRAAEFLMAEHDHIKTQYPSASQRTFQKAVLDAMINLDAYDETSDRKAARSLGLSDVAANTEVEMSAQAHRSRHMGFIRWATEPLRWVDDAIRWFLGVVNGPHKKKPKPAPAPDPGPSVDPGPAPAPGPSAAPNPNPSIP